MKFPRRVTRDAAGYMHLKYADPLTAGRHPFQTFLLSLCMVSGFPLLLGHVPSGSVEAALPHGLVIGWGVALFGGSAIALLGCYWPGGLDKALTMERIGLLFVSSGALIYATILLFTGTVIEALTATLILFAFSLSCYVRARDIGRIITRAGKSADQRFIVDTEDGR